MPLIQFTIEADQAGERLDRILPQLSEGLSRSYAQTLVEQGHIMVNGAPAKSSQKVREGDTVTIEIPETESVGIVAEPMDLSIVYEDPDILVVDKPAGLVVHPAPGHASGTLVNALLAHTDELSMHGEERPGIVHRLDKDTSGLLVVAKNDRAHANLVGQHQARTMQKEYLALVLGHIEPARGLIDAPIGRSPYDRQRQAVIPSGREARTRYTTEQSFSHYSLVRARLETGRTHQIRVHMAFIDHPILGDPIYGRSTVKEAARLGLRRQFLHATRLGFNLPSSGEWREFNSPLPEDLRQTLERVDSGE